MWHLSGLMMKSPGSPPSLSCSVVGLVVWIGAREQRSWLQLFFFLYFHQQNHIVPCSSAWLLCAEGLGCLGTTLEVSRKKWNGAAVILSSAPEWCYFISKMALPLWGQVNFVVWKMCSVKAPKSSCKPPKASEFLDRKAITCRFLPSYRKFYFWVYST